jgi:hypothetical protein
LGRGDGRRKSGQEQETGEDLIREYERRGRSRSRHPRPRHGYYDEDRSLRERERELGLSNAAGRQDGRRLDGSGDRPLDLALSESPSREQAMSGAREDMANGCGTYRTEEKVTDSMRVQYGSPHDAPPSARPERSDRRRRQ